MEPLNLTYDGVILRGEGNCFSENDSTVLYGRNASEKAKRLILMGNSSAHNWGNGKGNNQVNINNPEGNAGRLFISGN